MVPTFFPDRKNHIWLTLRILTGQTETLRTISRLISVKLSSHHHTLVRRSKWRNFLTGLIFYPCYINEYTSDRWWRNHTTQSWENDKKELRNKVTIISFSLAQLFLRWMEVKCRKIEGRIRDGNKVLWADQSPFAHREREDQMKNEKRTQESVTEEDSRVTERQGKRHSCALVHAWQISARGFIIAR